MTLVSPLARPRKCYQQLTEEFRTHEVCYRRYSSSMCLEHLSESARFPELYSALRVSHIVINGSQGVSTLLQQGQFATSVMKALGAESDKMHALSTTFE